MNGLREQFLERFTRALFSRKGEGFVLKGGGAVRALFGDQRLTKDIDLDFTNPKRTAQSLHKTVLTAINRAARGLPLTDISISEPGRRELSPRWKINLADNRGQSAHVEIEVSRDPARAIPGRIVQKRIAGRLDPGGGPFWVDIYDEQSLLVTKLAALLGRSACRDAYDIDLLKDIAPRPDTDRIQWALSRAELTVSQARETLWAHLDEMDFDRFVSELADALPESVRERMDEEEWTALKLRVGEFTERCLEGVVP